MVKRTFGNWITRLLRGGQTLTDAEHRLLCLLVGELPPHLRDTVERQFESYKPLHTVLTAVSGRAFSVSFNRAVSEGVKPEAISVDKVTQAWKSNFVGEQNVGLVPGAQQAVAADRRQRSRGASASLRLAPRWSAQRAAAELRR
jgi:hypothetical protein